jgi:hypothetical protein
VVRVRLTDMVIFRWAFATLLVATVFAAGCTSSHPQARGSSPAPKTSTAATGPVYVRDPTSRSATCVSTRMVEAPQGLPLVAVDLNPTGVVAIWNPGSNANPCQVSMTDGDGVLARNLATLIMSQPVQPVEFCALGDGRNVSRYFSFPHSNSVELVQKALNGCLELSAPRRGARSGRSADLDRLLATIAPPEYKSELMVAAQ